MITDSVTSKLMPQLRDADSQSLLVYRIYLACIGSTSTEKQLTCWTRIPQTVSSSMFGINELTTSSQPGKLSSKRELPVTRSSNPLVSTSTKRERRRNECPSIPVREELQALALGRQPPGPSACHKRCVGAIRDSPAVVVLAQIRVTRRSVRWSSASITDTSPPKTNSTCQLAKYVKGRRGKEVNIIEMLKETWSTRGARRG